MTSTVNDKTVTYQYYPSGLTKTSTPEGGQAITMEYNLQGKRTRMIDPDAGTVESFYDGFGELIWERQKVRNVNDFITTTNTYDDDAGLGLLSNINRNGEITTYTYDTNIKNRVNVIELKDKNSRVLNRQTFTYDPTKITDRVTSVKEEIADNNGNLKTYNAGKVYDALGRIKKEIYPSGYYTVNTYDNYSNLTEVRDEVGTGHSIWKADTENALGQATSIYKGAKRTIYDYNPVNHQTTSIYAAGVVNYTYGYDSKNNLSWRKDNLNSNNIQQEDFGYDELNRLISWKVTRGGIQTPYGIAYDLADNPANIKTKSGIETDPDHLLTMYYGGKNPNGTTTGRPDGSNIGPHALSTISGVPASPFPQTDLTVTYTDFKKIATLHEGTKDYELTYGVDDQRRMSVYKESGVTKLTRYYVGNYEEEVLSNGNVRKIHYLSGAVLIQTTGVADSLYYTYSDAQGSLIALVHDGGSVIQRFAYDPWGARRDPSNWNVKDSRTSFIINRGYTGHEHLDAFGIINMNGRVYDPLTAMFFSPDPYVQAPGNWLNYNRYGYCLGNPLKYTDPSGYWFGIDDLIVAGVGLVAGYLTYGIATGDWGWKALGAGVATAAGAWLVWNTGGAALKFVAGAYSSVLGGSLMTAGLLTTDVGYDLQKLVSPVAVHLNIGSKFGWEVSAGVPQVLPGYRYEYGKNGDETVEGGEWAFGIFKYSGHTFSDGQSTNKVNIGIPGFNVQYENDKDDININLPGITHSNGDKYRTSAGKLTVYGISVGYNLMTGEGTTGPKGEETYTKDGYEWHYEKNAKRLGLIYIGAGPLKLGYNSETIRNFLQNELIHKPNGYPLWEIRRDLLADSFYFYFGSTGGNTLW